MSTLIQFKRSSANATPTSLQTAEPAYSFQSGKLFVGNTSNVAVAVGGEFYTALIDAATDTNTNGAIVKRSGSGIISATALIGDLYGNANTATSAGTLTTPRFFNFSGDVDAVSGSFDGSGNVDITLELTNTGVSAGTYGGDSQVPVIVVDADGRVTSVSNVAAAASGAFNIDADTGSSSVLSSGETVEFIGGDGIDTSVSDVTPGVNVTIAVDSTVVRTTGNQTVGGEKTFSGDITITGNLTTSGTVTYANTQTLLIGDNILTLNADLPGAVAPSENAGIEVNRGSASNMQFRWNETDDNWELTEDGTNYKRVFHDAYANASSFTTGTLPSARVSGSYTGITGVGTIAAGTWQGTAIGVAYGGTNITSYTTGDIIYASGATTLSKLADVATGNALISGGVGVAPSWGKIGLATHVSGTLPVASGGTNITSYTTGDLVYASGSTTLSKLSDVATGNVLISGGVSTAPAWGKVGLTTHVTGTLAAGNGGTGQSSYTTGDILYASSSSALSALAGVATGNALISGGVGSAPSYGKIGLTTHITGTLAVGNGGTGATSFTSKGVIYGNGSSALQVTAAGTEGQVLQADASGNPVFGMLDGGAF